MLFVFKKFHNTFLIYNGWVTKHAHPLQSICLIESMYKGYIKYLPLVLRYKVRNECTATRFLEAFTRTHVTLKLSLITVRGWWQMDAKPTLITPIHECVAKLLSPLLSPQLASHAMQVKRTQRNIPSKLAYIPPT